ncbi:MAG: outer membrane beta-barrel protein [Candidatus Aminicenantes bacterium]|nr:outer membrane beta-barrel protein [Candidatus Aminicenantes bacterium]
MKRSIILVSLVLFILGALHAQESSIILETSYFRPSDQAFREIYGSGLQVGGKLQVDVLKKTSLWLGASYFSNKGELTFTKEEITLRIIPVYLGVGYRFTEEKVIPFLSVGMGIHFYREIAPLDTLKYARFGYLAQTGVWVELASKFSVELEVNYSSCTIKPEGTAINIGGIGIGIGLRYRLK